MGKKSRRVRTKQTKKENDKAKAKEIDTLNKVIISGGAEALMVYIQNTSGKDGRRSALQREEKKLERRVYEIYAELSKCDLMEEYRKEIGFFAKETNLIE